MYNNSIALVTEVDNNGIKMLVSSFILGVHYESSIGVSVDSRGEKRDYSLEVLIPSNFVCSEYYAEPKEYEKFAIDRKIDHFTLTEGQLIVLDAPDIPYDNFDDILNNMDNVYKIVSVSRFVSSMPHFEVMCK